MTMSSRLRPALLIAAAALGVGACAMSESTLLAEREKTGGCHGGAGVYHLSRTRFVAALKDGDFTITRAAEADRDRAYCLDFLLSGTAEESVIVQKSPEGLLQKVSSRSDDKSAQILKNLADTVLTIARGQGARAAGAAKAEAPAFTVEFDPLNPAEVALINTKLTQHKFCLMLWQVDQAGMRHPSDYCHDPLGGNTRELALNKIGVQAERGPLPPGTRGLFYRPRLPYQFFLFERRGNDWALMRTAIEEIENRSPVVAIGIDRAFFAKRSTSILFNNGVLTSIEIEKGSELAGAVEVPLHIVNGIAALPAQIVQLKIDNTNRRANLISAQEKLLSAQRAYNADLARINGTPQRSARLGDQTGNGGSIGPSKAMSPAPGVPGGPLAATEPPQCKADDRMCQCIALCLTRIDSATCKQSC